MAVALNAAQVLNCQHYLTYLEGYLIFYQNFSKQRFVFENVIEIVGGVYVFLITLFAVKKLEQTFTLRIEQGNF